MKILVDSQLKKSGFSNFKGTPQRIQGFSVKNYQDALKFWENLRFAKYLDAHQNNYYDKMIRAENYSFLDKLTSYKDKSGFVEKYCEFTGFPNLKVVSDKIVSTWQGCINNISQIQSFNIIDNGYDPTCSLGLKKAFPGSDLDKGYVVIEGNGYVADENTVNNFKGQLWENLDQRIVSLNHPDTFPSIYTKSQVEKMLDKLDKKAKEIESDLNIKSGMGTFIGLTAAALLGPLGIIGGCALAGVLLGNHFKELATTTDPYEAAKFNRKIAEKLSDSQEKEDVKNFAFFIEIMKANLNRVSQGKTDSIFSRIKESPFVDCSNVTQVEAWQNKINGGYMKSKLRNRERLETDFRSMTTETKYDLIKDIIKYGTDDQSNKFSQYFKNDDDIANRYEKLLNSLK